MTYVGSLEFEPEGEPPIKTIYLDFCDQYVDTLRHILRYTNPFDVIRELDVDGLVVVEVERYCCDVALVLRVTKLIYSDGLTADVNYFFYKDRCLWLPLAGVTDCGAIEEKYLVLDIISSTHPSEHHLLREVLKSVITPVWVGPYITLEKAKVGKYLYDKTATIMTVIDSEGTIRL